MTYPYRRPDTGYAVAGEIRLHREDALRVWSTLDHHPWNKVPDGGTVALIIVDDHDGRVSLEILGVRTHLGSDVLGVLLGEDHPLLVAQRDLRRRVLLGQSRRGRLALRQEDEMAQRKAEMAAIRARARALRGRS